MKRSRRLHVRTPSHHHGVEIHYCRPRSGRVIAIRSVKKTIPLNVIKVGVWPSHNLRSFDRFLIALPNHVRGVLNRLYLHFAEHERRRAPLGAFLFPARVSDRRGDCLLHSLEINCLRRFKDVKTDASRGVRIGRWARFCRTECPAKTRLIPFTRSGRIQRSIPSQGECFGSHLQRRDRQPTDPSITLSGLFSDLNGSAPSKGIGGPCFMFIGEGRGGRRPLN
jgi:hypothetical protein